MAKLDIAERRLPQDGRIQLKTLGKVIDLRVSTVPTLYGESLDLVDSLKLVFHRVFNGEDLFFSRI